MAESVNRYYIYTIVLSILISSSSERIGDRIG